MRKKQFIQLVQWQKKAEEPVQKELVEELPVKESPTEGSLVEEPLVEEPLAEEEPLEEEPPAEKGPIEEESTENCTIACSSDGEDDDGEAGTLDICNNDETCDRECANLLVVFNAKGFWDGLLGLME